MIFDNCSEGDSNFSLTIELPRFLILYDIMFFGVFFSWKVSLNDHKTMQKWKNKCNDKVKKRQSMRNIIKVFRGKWEIRIISKEYHQDFISILLRKNKTHCWIFWRIWNWETFWKYTKITILRSFPREKIESTWHISKKSGFQNQKNQGWSRSATTIETAQQLRALSLNGTNPCKDACRISVRASCLGPIIRDSKREIN